MLIMDRYTVQIVWSDEDQAFLASVPEMPGCMADGATHAEALENVQVVAKEWLEVAHVEKS
jgi:predicted RNase H-like HicB family nuclease